VRLDDRLLATVLDALPQWSAAPGLPTAAVLAPVVQRAAGDHLVFTVRPDDLPHHPGQVSFPGGRRQGAEDPVGCALRETEEEIGVPRRAVAPLGGLPARFASSGFRVEVCVGRLAADAPFVADPREVARIFEIPVAHLLVGSNWSLRPTPGSRTGRVTPHLPWQDTWVWGLTGLMTVALLQRIDPGFALPVDHLPAADH